MTAAVDAQTITPEQVHHWFSISMLRDEPPSLQSCASISAGMEWIWKNPPSPLASVPVSAAAKHARLLRQHLPGVITKLQEQVKFNENNVHMEVGADPNRITITLLQELDRSIALLMPVLKPPKRTFIHWHLVAASCETIILDATAHFDGRTGFAAKDDAPLTRFLALALDFMGFGSHPTATITTAILNIPQNQRPLISRRDWSRANARYGETIPKQHNRVNRKLSVT